MSEGGREGGRESRSIHGFYGDKARRGDSPPSRRLGEYGVRRATPYTYLNLDGVIETYLVATSFGSHVAHILPLPIVLDPCRMEPSCRMIVTASETFLQYD